MKQTIVTEKLIFKTAHSYLWNGEHIGKSKIYDHDYGWVVSPNFDYFRNYYFRNDNIEDNLVIPEEVNGQPVIIIQDFSGLRIRNIQLPRTILEIYADCFANCTLLEKLIIPHGVKSLGSNCFKNCRKLKTLIFNNCPYIRWTSEKMCQGCTKLEKVYLPKNLEQLGFNSFKSCKSLKSLKIKSKKLENLFVNQIFENSALEELALYSPEHLDELSKPILKYNYWERLIAKIAAGEGGMLKRVIALQ